MTSHDAANIVRTLYTAYQARDRELVERLLAKDFTFTSPLDDAIDKQAYFERCWPPGDDLAAFIVESVVTDGNAVLLHYRARWHNGQTADNVERLVVEDGKVRSVHVFFGRAPAGETSEDQAAMENVLAGVAVKSLTPAVAWYAALLGRGPTKRPMPEVAEWDFPKGGWLQVFADAARAGKSSVTLVERDVDARVAALGKLGVTVRATSAGDFVKTAVVDDPDGNQIVFAQAVSAGNASVR